MGIPKGEEVVSVELVRTVVEYIDQHLNSFAQEASLGRETVLQGVEKVGLKDNATLRENQNSEPGTVAYLLSGKWPQEKALPPGDRLPPTSSPITTSTPPRRWK
jgi:hypothetical protein